MSWQPVATLGAMAFDHLRILADGVERARAKLEYTSLGAAFCRDEFTVAELRRVYEIVWGTPLDPRNFHRKVTGAEGFLVDTGAASSSGGRRPSSTGAVTPTCCIPRCCGRSPGTHSRRPGNPRPARPTGTDPPTKLQLSRR